MAAEGDKGDDPPAGAERAPRRRRGAPRVTPQSLEDAAFFSLQRFSSSSANLRRVLLAKVERASRAHGTDRAEAARWIDALIARFEQAGLLDDRRYAAAKAGSLHRRGRSLEGIRRALQQQGVAPEQIAEAIGSLAEEASGEADLRAAIALARRRRLGPFRSPETRALHRRRDLSALGRAGFDFDTARRVLDADDGDTLLGEVGGG